MEYIFDSHAHYDDRAFDKDREELLSGLKDNGIDKVVNISASLDEIKDTLKLAERYDFIWAAVGVHPSDTYELKKEDINQIESYLSAPKVVAVGEIGLDYHYDDTDKKCQHEWFVSQIELAKKHGLPIVVHSRDAAADTYDILKQTHADDAGGVLHCFSYELPMAKKFMDMGFYLGIGGVVTFKNARKLKEIAEYMPMDLMLLETDCPYLAPTPFRGERNDSSMLRYVAEEISHIRKIPVDHVKRITNENACLMYRIDQSC